jgi:hypothetical protein
MIATSACRPWQPDRAVDTAQHAVATPRAGTRPPFTFVEPAEQPALGAHTAQPAAFGAPCRPGVHRPGIVGVLSQSLAQFGGQGIEAGPVVAGEALPDALALGDVVGAAGVCRGCHRAGQAISGPAEAIQRSGGRRPMMPARRRSGRSARATKPSGRASCSRAMLWAAGLLNAVEAAVGVAAGCNVCAGPGQQGSRAQIAPWTRQSFAPTPTTDRSDRTRAHQGAVTVARAAGLPIGSTLDGRIGWPSGECRSRSRRGLHSAHLHRALHQMS